MKLFLFHPGAYSIDCEDCKRFVYDLQTGKRKTYKRGPEREEVDQERPAGAPLQCQSCPKGSPEKAKEIDLTRRNLLTIDLFQKVRSVGVGYLNKRERKDSLLARNFSILFSIFQAWDRERTGQEIADQIAKRQNG